MKRFSEMNQRSVGTIGIVVVVLLLATTLSAGKLIRLTSGHGYRATFSQATGLKAGNDVRISGLKVGTVRSVELDGNRVVVTFSAGGVTLGSKTSAHIKAADALGGRFLQITPAGTGKLGDAGIPLSRTEPAYALTDALQDTTRTVGAIDTKQLAVSFDVLSQTLEKSPADLRGAVSGLRALSESVAKRDAALAALLDHANGVTGLLAHRSTQLTRILRDGDSVLAELAARRQVVASLMADIAAVTQQISGLTRDNRRTLRPALAELRKTLAVLTKNRAALDTTIKGLPAFVRSLGEAVGGGPFFYGYLQNLPPTTLAPVLPELFGVGTTPGYGAAK